MVLTKCEIINGLLKRYPPSTPAVVGEHSRVLLVHASIIEKLEKAWNKLFKNPERKIFEYTLQIGTKSYDMRIIYVTQNDKEISRLIESSQFSFLWEDNPNLYINLESFHILQEFITNHNLQSHILKIEEEPGITANDEIIKVVTFKKCVERNELSLIEDYEIYLNSNCTGNDHRLQYYYVTHGFSWLQPHKLRHFKIPIDVEVFSVFPIILNHLETLNYTNQLNIFDLLSLRLAVCDFRNSTPSVNLKFEIDYMIKRELRKIIKNNFLDLHQYAIVLNDQHDSITKRILCDYLVYEFQQFFAAVKVINTEVVTSIGLLKWINNINVTKLSDTIDLAQERDVLNKLKKKSNNKQFVINGRSYDRMSLSLFLDLIECDNVTAITLDTNYRWLNDACDLNRFIGYSRRLVYITLLEPNTFNFIEDFVTSLKTITFLEGQLCICIHANLIDCRVFDNITVGRIELRGINIDNHKLNGLSECNLKSPFNIFRCTFENTCHNWVLLNNLKELEHVEIYEDEGTWPTMFEFIQDELRKSNATEFQFNKDIQVIPTDDSMNVELINFKFIIDDTNSKLEMRYKFNNEIFDLYFKQYSSYNILELGDRSDYDFYQ